MRMAGMRLSILLNLGHQFEYGGFTLFPGFEHHAAKARIGKGDLKGELRFRNAHECIIDGFSDA
jgi:hypothetical protein